MTTQNHKIPTRLIKTKKKCHGLNIVEWISISTTIPGVDWLKYEREITWMLAENNDIPSHHSRQNSRTFA